MRLVSLGRKNSRPVWTVHARISVRFDAGHIFFWSIKPFCFDPNSSPSPTHTRPDLSRSSSTFVLVPSKRHSLKICENAACINFKGIDPRSIVNIQAPSYCLCWLQCPAAALRTQGMQDSKDQYGLGKISEEIMSN